MLLSKKAANGTAWECGGCSLSGVASCREKMNKHREQAAESVTGVSALFAMDTTGSRCTKDSTAVSMREDGWRGIGREKMRG